MRRIRRGPAWIALLMAAATGCAAILGGEAGVLDEGAASVEAGSADSNPDRDADRADGAGDATVSADAGTDATPEAGPGCPEAGGGPLVRAGSFCIDRTEVTVAQYTLFLAAKGGDVSGQPAECAANTTYVPSSGFTPSVTNNFPVVNVSWCDAYMFCKWAGKRLCGGTDGGAATFSGAGLTTESQWYNACSHAADGQHLYPYGNSFNASACAIDADGGALIEAGSKAGCVGGYPGIFDMSGNVREWEDSCTPAADGGPAFDLCRRRGGAADDTAAENACAPVQVLARGSVTAHTGFRCCGP